MSIYIRGPQDKTSQKSIPNLEVIRLTMASDLMEIGGDGSKVNAYGCGRQLQNLPLPPCALQPPIYYRRQSSLKRLLHMQEGDDPFTAAYKRCTKTHNETWKRIMSIFSCKRSCCCAVRDNNLFRISHDSTPNTVDYLEGKFVYNI